MNRNIFLVALGGMLGSVSRYLITDLFSVNITSSFPFSTFIINVSGCFLIGLISAIADRENIISPELALTLTTGFCGGYTTFSAFSLESVKLAETGEFLYLALYLGLSVVAGLSATILGILLVRSVYN